MVNRLTLDLNREKMTWSIPRTLKAEVKSVFGLLIVSQHRRTKNRSKTQKYKGAHRRSVSDLITILQY